ncbi:MAG: toxin-antitoxin system YwqK family antitoxin [Deltaproteobacteria bacterium]|nr:toxin-antitoxin system YwqK family antitoxin [Deltaproteobacteria bacterium]
MLPLLSALGAALTITLAALLIFRLRWRERLTSSGKNWEVQGKICGPGQTLDVVAQENLHRCAEAQAPLLIWAKGQKIRVDVNGAHLQLRWRRKRGNDLRVGDGIAIWGLAPDVAETWAATRVIRAGWPGLLSLCIMTSCAIAATITAYLLMQPSGCPSGTRPQLLRERSITERACVREDGTRHGPALERTHGGRLRADGFYNNGVKEGVWRRYHRNGKLAERVTYHADKRHGPWHRYTPDGVFLAQAHMRRGKGVFETLHPNAKVAERGKMVAGKREERWKYFRNDGSQAGEGHFKRGKKHGSWKTWHESGKLAWESIFVRGKKHGAWRSFFKDGTLEKEGAFVHGKREGLWRFYHPDGKVARSGPFTEGKKQGAWTLYNPKGKVQIEGHYQEGRRVGAWRWHCSDCKDCDVCSVAQRDTGVVVKKDYGAPSTQPHLDQKSLP